METREHKGNNDGLVKSICVDSSEKPRKLDHLRTAWRPQRDAPCRAPVCDASGASMRVRVDFGDAECIGCPKSRDRPDTIPASTSADPAGHAPTARRARHRCRHLRDRRSMHWDGDPGRARGDLFPDAAQPGDELHPVALRWNSALRTPCVADPRSCALHRACTRVLGSET